MPKRAKGSRGAALVEAAIVTPFFLLMVFAVLEFGYGFMDRQTVKNASITGARVASSEGLNGIADYNILQSVKRASSAMKSTKVQLVIVYKASSYTASVPTACKTASTNNGTIFCNRYTGADFAKDSSYFGCQTGDLDLAWCPITRKTAVSGPNGPPDYVGIYIQGRHDNLSGLFGSGYDFKSDTVMRLEPTRLG